MERFGSPYTECIKNPVIPHGGYGQYYIYDRENCYYIEQRKNIYNNCNCSNNEFSVKEMFPKGTPLCYQWQHNNISYLLKMKNCIVDANKKWNPKVFDNICVPACVTSQYDYKVTYAQWPLKSQIKSFLHTFVTNYKHKFTSFLNAMQMSIKDSETSLQKSLDNIFEVTKDEDWYQNKSAGLYVAQQLKK